MFNFYFVFRKIQRNISATRSSLFLIFIVARPVAPRIDYIKISPDKWNMKEEVDIVGLILAFSLLAVT